MNNKGSGIISILLKYFRHSLKARHRNGHGIHSPFVYELVRDILYNKKKLTLPSELEEAHRSLRNDKQKLDIENIGAGSRVSESLRRSAASMARKSSVSFKQARVLYRLAKWYQPSVIIEYGTGLGISTMYLHSGAPESRMITMEASFSKSDYARKIPLLTEKRNISFLQGEFKDFAKIIQDECENHLLVFIDGDHRFQPTLDKVNFFLQQDEIKEALIILDDIYWSRGMEQAWRDCISASNECISLDLFHFGIIIKRPGIAAQTFRVKI